MSQKKKRSKPKSKAQRQRELEARLQRYGAEKDDSSVQEGGSAAGDVEVEYVTDIEAPRDAPKEVMEVFENFKSMAQAGIAQEEEEEESADADAKPSEKKTAPARRVEIDQSMDMDMDVEELEDNKFSVDVSRLSNKQRKKVLRMSVAELKQNVPFPEVVEVHDVTSSEPLFLVYMKTIRNSVPVPNHWCHRRAYMQGKRGFEKPPFPLPDFIEDTGILEVREAYHEKEAAKSAKQKMRERIRPKMGKIDIDYERLQDAFYRFQRKPKLTKHGDLYFEGKENLIKAQQKGPSELSDKLVDALGLKVGHPPPWLFKMQQYGPPPSYPRLKIPGVNAPLPDGGTWGFHAGGWGKPPVDEYNRPLYGDIFGVSGTAEEQMDKERTLYMSARVKDIWGKIEDYQEEEEPEEVAVEAEAEAPDAAERAEVDATLPLEGTISTIPQTPGPDGLETPQVLDIRKKKTAISSTKDVPAAAAPAAPTGPKQLYQVLEQKDTSVGAGLVGTSHVYVVPGAEGGGEAAAKSSKRGSTVDIALNPEELSGLDEAMIREKYEENLRQQSASSKRSDRPSHLAHMALEESRKRRKKDSQSSRLKSAF